LFQQLKTRASDDVILMTVGNQIPAANNNSWSIYVADHTVKNDISSADLLLEGLPAGIEVSVQKEDDHHILIILSGSADTAIDSPVTVTATVKGSAVLESGCGDSFELLLTINPIEDCFIATAAFGSYLDAHVGVLRQFRDEVLLKSDLGTSFVNAYYQHSPPIAAVIAQYPLLRYSTRIILTPIVFAIEYPLAASTSIIIILLLIIRKVPGSAAEKGRII
jgi:hypothetical protein